MLPYPLAQTDPGSGLSFILPMALIFVVFYLFMVRPQARREKQRRGMIDALKKGDRVVTVGGIHGSVVRVEDAALLVQVDENVKLRVDKNAIASVAAKDQPVAPAKAAPASEPSV